MNSTWNINPKPVALRHSSTYPILPFGILHGLGLKRGKEKGKKKKEGKKKSYSSSAHRGYSENPKENKKTSNFQHLMQ